MEIAPEIQKFLELVTLSIISIIVPALAYAVRQWLVQRIAEGRSRLSLEQVMFLDMTIDMLVKSAEQSGLVGLIRNEGEAKKQWVIERAYQEAQKRGFSDIDIQLIADTIEAKINEGVHKPMISIAAIESSDDDDPFNYRLN